MEKKKRNISLLVLITIVIMVSIYGYVRYKERKYIEVAMDYKETIYKATEISYMMVYNIKRINDNSILLINDNQHKGENEKCVALDQVMKNRMHVDNIIRKGGDVFYEQK